MNATDSWLERWAAAVNTDSESRHIGRFSRFEVTLEWEQGRTIHLQYSAGLLTLAAPAGDEVALDRVHLRGSGAAWRELLDATAAPLRHDLLSLLKAENGLEVVSGWIELVRNLRVIARLVEIGKYDVQP